MNAWRATGALAAAAMLSGCVAAALPLAAAGALARGKAPAEAAPKSKKTRGSKRASAKGVTAEILPLTALPPPDGVIASPADAFAAYALAQHRLGVAGEKRVSAVMAPDSTLSRPTIVPCERRPTAVIVDADLRDGGAVLSSALARLRSEGVKVLWTMDDDRTATTVSATLGPAGFSAGDVVLAPRTQAQRKQFVRQLATIDHCIVAIAGRRRGDMDELYDYLKDPDTLVPSDILWNRGWFLIPATPGPRSATEGRP